MKKGFKITSIPKIQHDGRNRLGLSIWVAVDDFVSQMARKIEEEELFDPTPPVIHNDIVGNKKLTKPKLVDIINNNDEDPNPNEHIPPRKFFIDASEDTLFIDPDLVDMNMNVLEDNDLFDLDPNIGKGNNKIVHYRVNKVGKKVKRNHSSRDKTAASEQRNQNSRDFMQARRSLSANIYHVDTMNELIMICNMHLNKTLHFILIAIYIQLLSALIVDYLLGTWIDLDNLPVRRRKVDTNNQTKKKSYDFRVINNHFKRHQFSHQIYKYIYGYDIDTNIIFNSHQGSDVYNYISYLPARNMNKILLLLESYPQIQPFFHPNAYKTNPTQQTFSFLCFYHVTQIVISAPKVYRPILITLAQLLISIVHSHVPVGAGVPANTSDGIEKYIKLLFPQRLRRNISQRLGDDEMPLFDVGSGDNSVTEGVMVGRTCIPDLPPLLDNLFQPSTFTKDKKIKRKTINSTPNQQRKVVTSRKDQTMFSSQDANSKYTYTHPEKNHGVIPELITSQAMILPLIREDSTQFDLLSYYFYEFKVMSLMKQDPNCPTPAFMTALSQYYNNQPFSLPGSFNVINPIGKGEHNFDVGEIQDKQIDLGDWASMHLLPPLIHSNDVNDPIGDNSDLNADNNVVDLNDSDCGDTSSSFRDCSSQDDFECENPSQDDFRCENPSQDDFGCENPSQDDCVINNPSQDDCLINNPSQDNIRPVKKANEKSIKKVMKGIMNDDENDDAKGREQVDTLYNEYQKMFKFYKQDTIRQVLNLINVITRRLVEYGDVFSTTFLPPNGDKYETLGLCKMSSNKASSEGRIINYPTVPITLPSWYNKQTIKNNLNIDKSSTTPFTKATTRFTNTALHLSSISFQYHNIRSDFTNTTSIVKTIQEAKGVVDHIMQNWSNLQVSHLVTEKLMPLYLRSCMVVRESFEVNLQRKKCHYAMSRGGLKPNQCLHDPPCFRPQWDIGSLRHSQSNITQYHQIQPATIITLQQLFPKISPHLHLYAVIAQFFALLTKKCVGNVTNIFQHRTLGTFMRFASCSFVSDQKFAQDRKSKTKAKTIFDEYTESLIDHVVEFSTAYISKKNEPELFGTKLNQHLIDNTLELPDYDQWRVDYPRKLVSLYKMIKDAVIYSNIEGQEFQAKKGSRSRFEGRLTSGENK